MAAKSAGILMYRRKANFELLLVHPGGPFWKNRDKGVWSIPKGEIMTGEEPIKAACREFEEELGFIPEGSPMHLGSIRQKGGKEVFAWALEGDCDTNNIICNEFSLEWPPRSGIIQNFPEIDRAEWFDIQTAREKINSAQIPLIDRLLEMLKK